MNAYQELKNRQQTEVNAFPLMAAFSAEQFANGMEKLGLNPEGDTDKIVSIGFGCFVRKSDLPAFHEMFDRHKKELDAAIAADETGEGFICDMFDYELANHEYTYTMCAGDALEALGYTLDDINADQRLVHGLYKAMKKQEAWAREHQW